MKTLQQFADANNLDLVAITYKGSKRKGYDLLLRVPVRGLNGSQNLRNIALSFEPRDYPKGSIYAGDKWYLRYVHHSYSGKRYFTRISPKILNSLPIDKTGYVL
jgi:hypothetical protein